METKAGTNRKGRKAKPWHAKSAILLALVFVLSAEPATSVYASRAGSDFMIEGRIANYKFSDTAEPAPGASAYDAPIMVRKTVEHLAGEGFDERDFELALTAAGYDWESVKTKPVNVVFVIDTTSSMNTADIPSEAGGTVKRINATFNAVNTYIDALYDMDNNERFGYIDTAIVSYGKSARVHFNPEDYDTVSAAMGGVGVKEVSVNDSSFTGTVTDHFIGNYIQNGPPPYGYSSGKADDSMYIYDQALPIFANFKAAFRNNTSMFFYNGSSMLHNIVNNMSRYSDTNIESGLLMANFLLKNKPNSGEAVNIVMLITDGEANSSSTLSMLENHPDLKTAVLGDGTFYSGGDALADLSVMAPGFDYYDKIMRNTALLASDPAFVSHLFDDVADPDNINFFTGVFHDLDRAEFDSSAGSLAATTLYPASINTATATERLQQLFARHVFWLAQIRTDFYRDRDNTVLVQGEDIFYEYNGSGEGSHASRPPYFQSLEEYFFESGRLTKDPRTLLVDYHEHQGVPTNASGSDSAKLFMQSAAGYIKGVSSGTVIYATGVGSDILMPEKLSPVASRSDTFFTCSNASDASISNAEELKRQFGVLGRVTSLEGIQNLTITDRIPLRADGAGDMDDDTFTVKAPYNQAVKARVWYYDGAGSIAQTDWVYYGGGGDGEIKVEDGATSVAYNFGTLYSQTVSSIKKSPEFPYKAELRIQIRANGGVVSGASDGVPDIDTNKNAAAAWRDRIGNHAVSYPIPKVGFLSPAKVAPDTGNDESTEQPPAAEPTSEKPPAEGPPEEPLPGEAPAEDLQARDRLTRELPTEEPQAPYTPGGSDPDIPPLPNTPGGSIIPDGDGWIELGADGAPLGRWEWAPDLDTWIFDEFPPLGNLPKTGYGPFVGFWLFLPLPSLLGLATVSGLTRLRRARH